MLDLVAGDQLAGELHVLDLVAGELHVLDLVAGELVAGDQAKENGRKDTSLAAAGRSLSFVNYI